MSVKKNQEIATAWAVVCLILDQVHKFYMIEIFNMEQVKNFKVCEFFNLVMVWNRGISFGMFQGHEYSNYFFMGLTTIIILLIFYLIKGAASKFEAIAFGMIIGGACGNLIDRIRYGAVADFFDVHMGDKHWPAFNIADSCVFLGAALLITSTIFIKEKKDAK